MIWSIVLVKVYFTDLSEYKIRPVYIFRKYDDEDYMFLPLSSNISRKGIIVDNSCLKNWDLNRSSVILIPKIGIVHKTLIQKKIWVINSDKIKEINAKLCKSLWCNKNN